MTSLLEVSGVGPAMMAALAQKGISTAEDLAVASPEVLLEIPGIGPTRVASLYAAAQVALGGEAQQGPQDLAREIELTAKGGKRKVPKVTKEAIAKESKKADGKTSVTTKAPKRTPNEKTSKSKSDAKKADQKAAEKKAAAKVKKKAAASKTKGKKSTDAPESKGKKKKSKGKKKKPSSKK